MSERREGPEASVVICTRRRPEKLERCLAALAEQDHDDHELLVVDNSDGDERSRAVAEAAGAGYIVERAVGISRARNAGARAATGETVAYIDDDAIAEPTWLTHLTKPLSDPRVAGAMGRTLVWPADSPVAKAQAAGGSSDAGGRAFRLDREAPDWLELANFGGVGSGTNMSFRRELFDSYPGFRESLGIGTGLLGEEHYWVFTLIRDGHVIAYEPEAVVHHEAPDSMEALRALQHETQRQNAAYCLMLLSEEPRYRGRVIKYALRGLEGRRREWRPPVSDPYGSRRERLAAALGATVLFGRWWRRHR